MYRKFVLEEVGGFNHDLITTDDEELDYRIRKRVTGFCTHPMRESGIIDARTGSAS